MGLKFHIQNIMYDFLTKKEDCEDVNTNLHKKKNAKKL